MPICRRFSLMPVVVLALAIAGPAAAQPKPLPPECKSLPNGGKVKIAGPDVVVPVACQSCAMGLGVPANAVVGFSDSSRNTCEFKLPSGENTGLCKKDTTCPAGTNRVSQNGVMVCTKAGPQVEFTCPAPPRVPDPPPAAQACVASIKAIEGQLATSAKNFATAAGASAKGSNPVSVGGAGMQAAAMLTVLAGAAPATLTLSLRKKATCDNLDPNNGTAVNDCRSATSDLRTAQERNRGIKLKFKDASAIAKREIREAIVSGRQDLRTAGDGLVAVLDSAEKAADVCTAELEKIAP
jgi:hypothetical protein